MTANTGGLATDTLCGIGASCYDSGDIPVTSRNRTSWSSATPDCADSAVNRTYTRFVIVAVPVCLFAVVMASLLNFYKYKSTVERIVRDRVLLVANGIDTSVQSALALGIGIGELRTLTPLIERELAADRILQSITVFDPAGTVLYDTNRADVGRTVPPDWLRAAVPAKGEWFIDAPGGFVVGIALRNSFDLTVAYLAIRTVRDAVDGSVGAMGRVIALAGTAAFVAVAALVCIVLAVLLRRFERDMRALEAALSGREAADGAVPGAFTGVAAELRSAVLAAETEFAELDPRPPGAG